MINRAVLIICCEDVLRGYDILLRNFGNSESRLKDDPARVYITVKDPSITPREDLQRRWLLLGAWRMRGTQLLIWPHAFPSLGSQSFDCIAVSARVLWWGLCFTSFAVSKWLAYFLNYVIDFSPLPSGQKMIFLNKKNSCSPSCVSTEPTSKSRWWQPLFSLCWGYGCGRRLCLANSANVKGIRATQTVFVILRVLIHICRGTC